MVTAIVATGPALVHYHGLNDGGGLTEEPSNDFFMALGQEFCEALSPPVADDLITPQDAYEVWLRAFSRPPSPIVLFGLTVDHLSRLREECER